MEENRVSRKVRPQNMNAYRGITPRPKDFATFWRRRMREADALPLRYRLTQSREVPNFAGCEMLDMWFAGMEGSRLHAKFLRPISEAAVPLVLQFHGYPGSSRSWAEQASFVGMGMAVIALDCPGQGGWGFDAGGFHGPTASGHIIAGLDGPPEKMYYVRLYQNVRILCRIVGQLEKINVSRVFVNGGSQGGAIALACAALNPMPADLHSMGMDGTDDVDLVNLAPTIRGQVLFGSCLLDSYAPPRAQAAIYNAIACEKFWRIYPKYGHERVNAFENDLVRFLRNGLDDFRQESRTVEGQRKESNGLFSERML